ncbi:MAG TPA: glycoside hydrolase family 2 TIM barrel-domain containing protein [Acidobacteriaceae bacterium]|jgi:beta-galactosidase|nr:glycoside hydrolase family 2 TIM barrel-domain containing protein [Acidobacteriaceae bacterium]
MSGSETNGGRRNRPSFSRRAFLAGAGSVAAASAAKQPLQALARPPGLVDPAMQAAAAMHSAGGVRFPEVFAPAEPFVHSSERPYRQGVCLNGAWQFQPCVLPQGFAEGHDPAPSLPTVEADRWERQAVYVPSPWNVNSFADHQGQGGDFRCYPSYPQAWEKVEMGWLRKKVRIPAAWKGRRVLLHFDAVAGNAEVLVNGRSVGSHFDIFLPFEFDITSAVSFGSSNEILVGVRKASLFDKAGRYGHRTYQGGSFWGQHIAGIWQDVHLVAVAPVHVADVFVQPQAAAGTLAVEVTLQNDSDEAVEVRLGAQAFPWLPRSTAPRFSPLSSSRLGTKAALTADEIRVQVPAHGRAVATLQSKVQGRLKLWSDTDPNLYGLVVKVRRGSQVVDSKYTRFGWRQIQFQGATVLLNGKPLLMHGDSWHFLGIPQMTRRYAWAWFTALHNAGLNAVRLHAQPYPPLYLDVADEMGILVLDETAAWASDGGPKLDDPEFWQDSERHLADLIRRDRNHPSIYGWSVCNEMLPIVTSVMRNPPGMLDVLVRYYGLWAGICRKLDPTRPWISADGDEDGKGQLPVFLIHYGGPETMQRAVDSGKPWGVGEAGDAYYATPPQVAVTNGERAYESFEGRMEGVAISSYQSLMDQRKYNATYRSVFNLVWYGLQPLALGMKDLSKPPVLDNGIFFSAPVDGKPGVQPQRLGPYCTTLNPGYDPSLSPYETWPLFEAIRDAAAEPPVAGKWSKPPEPPAPQPPPAIQPVAASAVAVLAAEGSTLQAALESVGLPRISPAVASMPQLLFLDGARPPTADAHARMDNVLQSGGTVVVWGGDLSTAAALNALLPSPLEITSRTASSLLPGKASAINYGLQPDNLYFCDQRPPEITTTGLGGPLIEKSTVLLEDCNTDWLKWNNQPEYAKTAMVLRSEREAKPSGVVLAEVRVGPGRIVLTTLSLAPRTIKAERVDRTVLANLGLALQAGMDSGKPLLKTGVLVRALACGFFPSQSPKIHPETAPANSFRAGAALSGKTWQPVFEEDGDFELTRLHLSGSAENAEAYFSFWVNSPRSLVDLLLEPNLPKVDLEVMQRGPVQAWLNGQIVVDKTGPDAAATAQGLKLEAGWNHFLLRIVHANGRGQFSARFTSNQPEFLTEIDSALEPP